MGWTGTEHEVPGSAECGVCSGAGLSREEQRWDPRSRSGREMGRGPQSRPAQLRLRVRQSPQQGEAGLVLAVPLCGGSRAPGEGRPRPPACAEWGDALACDSLTLHSGSVVLVWGWIQVMTLGPRAQGSRRDAEAHARGAPVPRGGSGSVMPGAGCHAPVEACALPGAEPCSAANSVPAPRTGPRGRPGPPPVQDPATPAKPFRHMTCSLVRGPGSLQGPPFSLPR